MHGKETEEHGNYNDWTTCEKSEQEVHMYMAIRDGGTVPVACQSGTAGAGAHTVPPMRKVALARQLSRYLLFGYTYYG